MYKFAARALFFAVLSFPLTAQYTINTIAGAGPQGFAGDGGPAASALLNLPFGMAFDGSGNFYIAEEGNRRVRKITNGIITTIAGNGSGSFGGDGGPAISASFDARGVAVDAAGNVYIADYTNHRIRKVNAATGGIITVAGNGNFAFSGDNGPATNAGICAPRQVALDTSGNLYITDSCNSRIRKVNASTGIITTVAGNGTTGLSGDGGPATSAALNDPQGVTLDGAGNIYISDTLNHRIRKVTIATGGITTVAGTTSGFAGDNGPATSAKLNSPTCVSLDTSGNLYISDFSNERIRRVAGGVITTIAGNGTSPFSGDGGPATSASLNAPEEVLADNAGNILIADAAHHRIRILTLDTASGPTANLVSLSPSAIPAGSAPTTLTVRGTGFTAGSIILLNGSPITTTFVDPTKLTASISGILQSAGMVSVRVGNSNTLTLRILAPIVSSLSPSSVSPGAAAFTLTVNGSNFNASSRVSFRGAILTTNLVNGNQLTAQVPANLVAAAGNFSVNVTVPNASADSYPVAFVVGTPALSCANNSGNIFQQLPLRFQGTAELLGDILLYCTGGTANQTLTSDITVYGDVNLTSRILNVGTQATEALLLIDEPGPPSQVLNTNVFQGILTAPNAITFRSVPIVEPGNTTRVLRIVNLRANVHQLGQIGTLTQSAINAFFFLSGGVILDNPLVQGPVGTSSLNPKVSVTSAADQRSVQVSFTEDFASLFRLRVAPGGLQSTPGVRYKTESGFVNPAVLPNAGLADSATRLLVQLSGVPNGVKVYAQVGPNGNDNAQLVATDSNGAGPASFIPGVGMFGGMYSQITITGGSGVAVWEVTRTSPDIVEGLQFHLMLTGMPPTPPKLGPITLVASPAPLSPATTASNSAPLPRVGSDTITNFVNMVLTSNSAATKFGVNTVLLSTRPSDPLRPKTTAPPPLPVQVGSTLNFTYALTNNGAGSAPQATVQSTLPSTLSFVNCVTSTGGACSNAMNSDMSNTVTASFGGSLPLGESPYVTIYAGVPMNATPGTIISVPALVSAGKTDPTPDDNALLTTFSLVSGTVMVRVALASSPANLNLQLGTDGAKPNPSMMVNQMGPISFSVPTQQSDPADPLNKRFVFTYWSDGYLDPNRTTVTPPIGGGTFVANFDTQYKLNVTASPPTRGTVSSTPSAEGSFYAVSSLVQVRAVPNADSVFTGFTGGVMSATNPSSFQMPAAQTTVVANFAPLVFTASPSALYFGATPGAALVTSQQTVNVLASPGVAWTASTNSAFITISQGQGTGNGSFTVSMVTPALPATGSVTGTITLTAQNVNISPVVNVTAAINQSAKLMGSFDTPENGTTNIVGAIPVTGWALDDIEVVKVDIWREPVTGESGGSNGLVYIGDAVFSVGARTDLPVLFPFVPLNYRGGWGYQLLTNFLPNAAGSGPPGNGTYKLHAIAHNKNGAIYDLPSKTSTVTTVSVDNIHAAKPFGTIDTPGQGGTASGNAYINFGWALTPKNEIIPVNGSTITVVVDGVPLGHPNYGNYRSDIANLFPGYLNSGGAVGFYYIDTTALANGVHTISWNVYDSANRGEGIGSRYFNVFNSGGPVAAPEEGAIEPATVMGADAVEIEEVAHVKLPLGAIDGYQLVDGERFPLPIGSSLKRGVFYWQPGPGFLGDYTLVFQRPDGTEAQVRVKIRPKTYPGTTDR